MIESDETPDRPGPAPFLEGLGDDRRLRWVLRSIVLVPIAIAAIRAVTTGWFPVGDAALLAVRSYDVGTQHHPWLGSWTSASLAIGEHVNNPGPLYSDILSPFMWTIGRIDSIGTATAVGVASINAASALGIMLISDRIGGWRLERWAMVVVSLFAWSMGSELLIDIWQPHALLLPFLLFALTTAALINGSWSLLPLWLFLISLVIQTHVGYLAPLAASGLAVVVVGITAFRRSGVGIGSVARSRTAIYSVGMIVVCWWQPFAEQLFGRGRGNLTRLVSNVGEGDITLGAGTAVRMVTAVVVRPVFWMRPDFDDAIPIGVPLTETADGPTLVLGGLPSRVLAVAGLVLIAVALALTWRAALRTRTRGRLAIVVVATTLVAAALIGTSAQIVGVVGFSNHQVRWLFAMAAFVHLVLIVAIADAAERRWGRAWLVNGVVVGLVLIATIANLPAYAQPLGPTVDRKAAEIGRAHV